MKRIPSYVMPQNPSHADRVIKRQFDHFNEVTRSRGWKEARTEAVAQALSVALWLEEMSSTQQTYELFQIMADQLLAPVLHENGHRP